MTGLPDILVYAPPASPVSVDPQQFAYWRSFIIGFGQELKTFDPNTYGLTAFIARNGSMR
jgi:hypothetical protein